ncbi:MAG: helix-turn-helix domain-containing protein [Firmicutes bacterium]|nr:helix-turn-helix domain-containing protein [Bacillota bacterium]
MKLNKDIIYNNLKDYMSVKYEGQNGSSKLLLQRPEFYLDRSGFFQENHVYVCSADHLPALPNIEDNVLLVCLGNAPQLAVFKRRCSLISVDENENIFRVFNIIQQIFNKYEDWETKLNKILRRGSSLQEILDVSKNIFDNPMILIGSDFRYLARTEEKYLRETMNINLDGESFDVDKMSTFLSVQDMSTHVKDPFVISALGTRSLATNIFDGDEYMGCFVVLEAYRELTAADSALSRFLYKFIKQAMLNNPLISSERSALRRVVKDIIAGVPIAYEQRRIIDLVNSQHAFVCMTLQPDALTSPFPNGYIPSVLESSFEDALAFEHAGEVIMLLQADKKTGLTDKQKDKLLELFEFIDCRAGMSLPFNNLLEVKNYYYQAYSALKNGILMKVDASIYNYDDYIVTELLLNSANGKPAHIFFSSGLTALVEYDRNSQVSYIDTLKIYLDNGMAVTKTAQDLFIHRSTLLDRLAHINRYIGEELEDPEKRLAIRIAIGIQGLYSEFE